MKEYKFSVDLVIDSQIQQSRYMAYRDSLKIIESPPKTGKSAPKCFGKD